VLGRAGFHASLLLTVLSRLPRPPDTFQHSMSDRPHCSFQIPFNSLFTFRQSFDVYSLIQRQINGAPKCRPHIASAVRNCRIPEAPPAHSPHEQPQCPRLQTHISRKIPPRFSWSTVFRVTINHTTPDASACCSTSDCSTLSDASQRFAAQRNASFTDTPSDGRRACSRATTEGGTAHQCYRR
jgi:hypothetical protein